MAKVVAPEVHAGPFPAHREAFLRSAPAAPRWLAELRDSAFQRYAESGLPSTRLEVWRRTNLRPLASVPFRLAGQPAVSSNEFAPYSLRALPAAEVVLVNGRLAPALSDLSSLPAGVRVRALSDVLARDPARLEPHLGRIAAFDRPELALVALNTAFLADGVLVEIEKGAVVDRPLHLLHLAAAAGSPAVSYPRLLILAGEASQATIVQTWAGVGKGHTFVDAVTEIDAGPGAVLDLAKLQSEREDATHAEVLAVRAARDSSVTTVLFSDGAALARNEVRVSLAEKGATAHLDGLFLGAGSQEVDNHTFVDHAVPHGTSLQLYKGILAGEARGVFTGSVIVRPGAMKTNASQENRNLLLSREAFVDTTPQLEIHADDVKCSHGSTIGQMEESAVFYLRSRGIPRAEARRMLAEAFASAVLERLRHAPLRARLAARVAEWFRRHGAEPDTGPVASVVPASEGRKPDAGAPQRAAAAALSTAGNAAAAGAPATQGRRP